MSDTYTPRRGRPTNAEVAARQGEPEVETHDAAVASKSRRKRAPVGGFRQRLDAPKREGYIRRWVNDEGIRPELLHSNYAYDFVLDTNTRTEGAGTRVSRVVGRKPSGEPMHAYLMETPVEEFAVGVAEKEDALKPFEEAIKSGRDAGGEFGEADQVYRPGFGSSLKRS